MPSYYFIENGLYNYEISLYTPAIFKVVDGITVCAFETYIDTNLINELNDFNNINLYYYQDFESLYELDYSFKCLFYNGLDEITRNSVESIFNENKNSNTKLFYINYSNLDEVEKNELYHFYYEVGSIAEVTTDDIKFNSCPVKWDAFDDKMKNALIEVAKIVIAEEINSNLDGVHAEYDSNVMEPRWKVDSLLSALYFSIFYMKPNIEITRQCANPTCGRYFTVSRTSSKKKYCCDDCRNRALQNRYRAKHRK